MLEHTHNEKTFFTLNSTLFQNLPQQEEIVIELQIFDPPFGSGQFLTSRSILGFSIQLLPHVHRCVSKSRFVKEVKKFTPFLFNAKWL